MRDEQIYPWLLCNLSCIAAPLVGGFCLGNDDGVPHCILLLRLAEILRVVRFDYEIWLVIPLFDPGSIVNGKNAATGLEPLSSVRVVFEDNRESPLGIRVKLLRR